MTGLAGAGVSPFEADEPQPKRGQSSPLIWAAIAFVIVGAIVVGIFGMRRVLNRQTEPAPASSPEVLAANAPSPISTSENPSSLSVSTPGSRPNGIGTEPESKMTSSPQSKANATPAPAAAQADPVLFPPNSKSTPAMTASPAIDYSRVFSSREIDSKPRMLSKPAPYYTDDARKNQVTGTVVLRVVFSSTGSVSNISVVRGLPNGLSEQAIAAARKIKFEPAMKDGRPVSVSMLLEYNFNLY
jgi:TonB family protein